MDAKEIVDAQIDSRTKSVVVSALVDDLSEKKVKNLLIRKGFPVTAFEKVIEQVETE